MSDRVRRNGLMASCEPCRKSKLRCDHTRPMCSRCIRRGLSMQQCHYHPAPLAQQQKNATKTVSQVPAPKTSIVASSTISVPASTSQPDALDRSTGFVGMHHSLQAFADPEPLHRTCAALTRMGMFRPRKGIVTTSMISEGASVLEEILELTVNEADINAWLTDHPGTVTGSLIAVAAWSATFKALKNLGSKTSRNELLQISQALCEQTLKPLQYPLFANNRALEDMLSHDTVRWDTIGLYCAIVGCFYASERLVHVASSPAQRNVLARKAYFASVQCDALCQRLDSATDLNLWLLAEAGMLATWCFGDDSYHAFRITSNLLTVAFALGYHKGVHGDYLVPAYAVELRRRIMVVIHEYDKVFATFVGRPPRLSRHYCVIELPLDLPDSVLSGTAEDFEAATMKLDSHGWNTDGVIHAATRQRAALLLINVREEVLELSLGPELPDLQHRARTVLLKLATTWQSIPCSNRSGSEWDDLPVHVAAWISGLRLEYLYSEFLLHKLLVNENETNRVKLIHVSHSVLTLVLSLMKKKRLARIDMEWVMVLYAMPCASILLLELFRQCSQPHSEIILNRSIIIQDLYTLISCCDWFPESGQSNYAICKQAQSIFSRGLAQMLDGTDAVSQEPPRTAGITAKHHQISNFVPDMGTPGGFVQDPEWNAWLESFGLEGEQWLDFSIENLESDA